MAKRTIDIVVNPRAGAGRASRTLGDVVRELGLAGVEARVHPTERAGHAGDLVRALYKSGAEIVGVMGGDGTFHEALAGLHDGHGKRSAPPDALMALLPAGTGGDLRKTLDVPEEPKALARFIADAVPRAFDLGEVSFRRFDGENEVRWFANIASFGMGGLVDRIVNAGPKWIGGKASFFVASARATLAYRNVPVRVTVDGALFYEGPVFNVAVANGRAFGGGMFIAPEANPHDGLFDVVVLGDMSKLESTALARFIYDGKHVGRRGVTTTRGKVVRAECLAWREALLDIDGEAPGRLDATFKVLPNAIRMLERP